MYRPLVIGLIWRGKVEFTGGWGARLWVHVSTTGVVVGIQSFLVDLLFVIIIFNFSATLDSLVAAVGETNNVRVRHLTFTRHHRRR